MQTIYRLEVGGEIVPVESDPDMVDDRGQYTHGIRPQIRIAAGMPKDVTLRTVLHELLHCFEDLYGLSLGERRVRGLERLIVDSMSDNPDFWQALCGVYRPEEAEIRLPPGQPGPTP